MSFNLQWTRDGVDIPGATNNTYVVQAADKGHTLFFRAVATGPGGSTPATSPGVFVPADTPALTISGTPPSSGVVGSPYAFTPSASGGTPPYVFSMPSGSLPTGLSFNTSTGAITGTPTTAQVKTGLVIRVTDHLGATASLPSFSITIAATGTPVNPSNWASILRASAPGAILTMDAGNYTDIDISSINKAAPGVVLQGQAGVTAPYLALNGCSGITFTGIAVTSLRTGQYGCYAISCDRVVFDHITQAGNNPGAEHGGVGVFIRASTNMGVTNCTLQNLGDGIDGLDVTGLVISGNHIAQVSSNFIFQSSVHNAVIEKNYLANLDFLSPGTHPDSIQIAGTGTTGRSTNVVIRYNNFDAKTGDTTCQGIAFCESTDGLTITSNCVFGAGDNGALTSDCTNVIITNNFEQGWVSSPRIYCRGGCNIVNMTGNFSQIAPFSLHQPPEPDSTNVTIGVNTLIPAATSSSDTTRRNNFLQANPLIPVS